MVKTNISLNPGGGATGFTAGRGIDANRLKMKIIEVYLKSNPNLIHVVGDGRAEEGALYVDLQIPEDAIPTTNFEIGVTTGHVLQSNGWIADGTLIVAKNPDSEFQMLCSDTGVVYYKKGDEWELLGGSGFVIEEAVCELFDSTKSYQAGDIVIHQGNRFIANEDIPAGAWDQTKWTHETIQEAIDKKSQSMFVTEDEYNALPARKESDGNLYIFVDEHPTIVEPESVVFKVRADENGNLVIGTGGGRNTVGVTESVPYDWDIRIDGSRESTRYQKAWSDPITRSLTIATGLTPNSLHTVKITPHNTSSPYKRARAYGWSASGVAPLLTEIIYDACPKGFCDSATNTGPYYKANIYEGCTSLTRPAVEYIPDGITTMGVCAFKEQYRNCTGLIAPAEESMPDTVTSIGDWYKGNQYEGCRFKKAADEVIAPGVSLNVYGYRMQQYAYNTQLEETGAEAIPTTQKTVGEAFRASQFRGCTNLNTIKLWVNSNYRGGASNFRDGQFRDCTSDITMRVEGQPNDYVGYMGALDGEKVVKCLVPSEYLADYQNSTYYPRRTMDDSVFEGY